ncbi:MAG TPA: isoleucine--tRNA ligase [Candidatus Saccharimonadales bacterium]|nr:isoleucine--tRNA ligase [Candidatus Saccharimonadales bacterium]
MANKSPFNEIEQNVQKLWDKEKTFEKSVRNREGQELYSFYDGPPFANGLPHFGHSLVTSIKDAMLRYKTMRGYYVPRRNGWDCHGLPVEFAIEKEFGVSGKKQIMELGLEKFNAACRASIFRYKDDWEHLLSRIGRWSDYENYYATVNTSYTESVWWALSEIHKKDLLYKGYKSAPYCPRCETPLSNFEVNEGYKDDVTDPSLYVLFPLADGRKLLAWTTTPWSLGGNTAIVINPAEQYVTVELKDDDGQTEQLILAKKRLEVLDEDYSVVKEEKGSDLVGLSYEPIYKLDAKLYPQIKDNNIYKVWGASFASVEDGTGIVHVAPATGVDDLDLSEKYQIPIIHVVDRSGKLLGGFGFDEVRGKFFKGADRPIIEHLTREGRVFAAETLQHTYPFCWRCETPLLYYAINSWFIKVSSIRSDLVKTAEDINWVPEHIKQGRFGKWLGGARDWAVSRNRYWGAPLPIWVNEADESDYIVVSSIEELKELAGDDIKVDDLHRPFIDEITFTLDGKKYKRVEEVLDCWFESGCMSFAQFHYPFENKDGFKQSFPADFIIEGLDQTRLWFYVQHVVNTILFESPAYKNVVVNGIIMAADGQKLSKRLRNYPPLDDVFENEGADSLRLFLLSSTQATQTADYLRFNRDALEDLNRNVLGTLMNTYRFFSMYADIDGWKPSGSLTVPKSTNVLDEWLIARLNETVQIVTKQADDYKIAHAIEPIFALIDDTSNWYVRRSRRRFWKSEDDGDKQSAYITLHFVLTVTMQLLAPWAPFISDHLWRELTAGMDLPNSVHLSDWPKAIEPDAEILKQMAQAREYINEGLSQRAAAGIKVRQPLATLAIPKLSKELQTVVAEEVNVKAITTGKDVRLDTKLTNELKSEGLMRELVRHIQSGRKKAGLNVEDRIRLGLNTDSTVVRQTIKQHEVTIKAETLAVELKDAVIDGGYSEEVKIDGNPVTISLKKHS